MMMEAGSDVNQTDPLAVPRMVQSPMPTQSCVDFLAESSAYLPKSPYEDMLERISSGSGMHAAGEVSEFKKDLLYGSSLGKASGSGSIDFSMYMDPWKQHTSSTDTFTEAGSSTVSQVDQKLTLAAPGFPSRPRQSATEQRSGITDRARRVRIAEKVTALEELLPQPVEGYGHYFLHQQMQSESLEELIGKLLETNPVAAEQLLQDKGLLMVPLGVTKKLF